MGLAQDNCQNNLFDHQELNRNSGFLDTFLIIFGLLGVIIKIMSDLLFLAIIVAFLLATAGLIILCQRLMKQ